VDFPLLLYIGGGVMVFYSDKFYYNGVYSQDLGILLVSESSSVLNEYGISYVSREEENEIVLSFCCVDRVEQPLPWDNEVLETVLEWFIADEYLEFISEDNIDLVYFLKGIGYTKRFTPDMKGIVDVTFKVLSNYGYRNYEKKIENPVDKFIISNNSNVNKPCKPIIELTNISSNLIKITNLTTNKTPFTIETQSNKSISIDNETGIILGDDNKNLIMNSNRKWIELIKGDNSILVEGNCDVTFKIYCPVMV